MNDEDVDAVAGLLGWNVFAETLRRDIEKNGCNKTYRFTSIILRRIGLWQSMKMWFEINRVACDCQVLGVVENIAKVGGLPTLAKFCGKIAQNN